MKIHNHALPLRVVHSFLLIVLLIAAGHTQTAKGEERLTVEGVWELISVNSKAMQKDIGKTVSISRKGDGYEVRSMGGVVDIYSGDPSRIVCTIIQRLGVGGGPTKADEPIPPSVLKQAAAQKVPINYSYALSGDGRFLQQAYDEVLLYYTKSGSFHHYEIKPGSIKLTFKRVSGPPKPAPPKRPLASAMAQVESRGEFYVLARDGRKLTGKDTGQIPLEEGTRVITGSDGHVRMRLPDDTTFTIGPSSDIVIDSFVYDPDNTPKKVIANMSKGVFRWVTGKTRSLKDPAELKVKLPVMAVGIRGTDFEAAVSPDGSGSVVLHFGQLEITENKTGFTFILNAGYKVIFTADGSVSRPVKVD